MRYSTLFTLASYYWSHFDKWANTASPVTANKMLLFKTKALIAEDRSTSL